MPSNHLPRAVLYGLHTVLGQLIGQRIKGGQKKTFQRRSHPKNCSIPFSVLEAITADRDTWRSTCENGLATFLAASGQATDRTVTQEDMLPPTPLPAASLSYLQQNLCLRIWTSESPPQSLVTLRSVAQRRRRHPRTIAKQGKPAVMCKSLKSISPPLFPFLLSSHFFPIAYVRRS